MRQAAPQTEAVFSVAPLAIAPAPAVSNSGWCINMGYEAISGSYDLTAMAAQLNHLKASGFTCVRLAFYGQNAGVTKPLALLAKSLGFYVEIGNDDDPTASSYPSGVVAEAQWAQANHIDQMSIGNEADAGGANQAVLAKLSCAVKAVFSGVLSYDTFKGSYDPIKGWASNLGCLDELGLNIYADYANTMAEAQSLLPGRYYVSETNLDCDAGLCANDVTWAAGLQKLVGIYKGYSVRVNWFSYDCGGDNVALHWCIAGHPAIESILGIK